MANMAVPVMENMMFVENLLKILNHKLSKSVISTDHSKESIDIKVGNGKHIHGFLPSVMHIINTAPKFVGQDAETEAANYQWAEYCLLNMNQTTKTKTLDELNSYFCDKTFVLQTSKLTAADVLLYVFLHQYFKNMSFYEKECYSNLSRWFKQMQYEVNAEDVCSHIIFMKTSLYT